MFDRTEFESSSTCITDTEFAGVAKHYPELPLSLTLRRRMLLVSAYWGDVTQLTTASAWQRGVFAQAHYSRDHETEVDTFALPYLAENGLAHHHFADILRALQKDSRPDPEHGFWYLASHPPMTERIHRFEK